MLIASNFLLWVTVLLMVVVLATLAQRVRILLERLGSPNGPGGGGALRANQLAPLIVEKTVDGQVITFGGPSDVGRPVLIMFVAPDCAVCTRLIPLTMILARAERLRLVFVGNGEAEAIHAMMERHKIAARDFVNSAQVGLLYQVRERPHAVLIHPDGIVAACGLVNNREHLESLVVASKAVRTGEQGFLAATVADEARA